MANHGLKKLIAAFLIWLIGGWPTLVFALPQDGQIVGGSGSITEPNESTMQIYQNTQQMIINWQSFNIGASEWVNFNQPNSSAIALNRVIGTDPSIIAGKLTANGQVFVSNGSGVFFTPGSQVDVHGLVATTMGISDQDFLNQTYNWLQDPGNLSAVINEGNISATSYVGLLAPAVENRGEIVTASLGSIDLASGTAATMDFTGDGLINFEVTEAVSGTVLDKDGNELKDRVSNTGLLQANGGQIRMSAKDAGDVIRHVVNMEGMIKANSVVEKDGRVFLSGGPSGVVNVSGAIDASGDDAGEKGGTVHVTGEKVGLFDDARVDVSGDAGGGTALIGGDYQGKNPTVQNAKRTFVGQDAVIDASGGASGSGGKVIVWADEITRFYGSVKATGGLTGGNGGFAEVSGKGNLDFHANEIDLSAANGEDGTLLLDPLNITITASADSNTTGFTVGSDQTEAFAEDSGLTSNFDVTAGSGSFAGVTGAIELQATNDITVSAAWNIATSTGNSNVNVVLRAGNDININAAITLDGTGILTLEADGNTANGVGDVVFGASGSVTTGGGNVDITANDINLDSGSINASTGGVTITVSDTGVMALGTTASGMNISGTELQNISAANLTLTAGTTGSTLIEGITAANSNNITGTVTLVGDGGITFQNTASTFNALTVNGDDGVVVNVNLTTETGNLSMDGDADNTPNSSGVLQFAAGVTVTSAGTMTLDATQGGVIGLGAVTLNAGGLITNNDAFSVTGNLTMVTSGNITQSAAVTVGGNSSFTSTGGSITLNNGSNDLGTFLTLSTTDSFDISTTSDLADLNITVTPTGSSTYSISATNLTFNVTESTNVTVTSVVDTTNLNFSLTSNTGNIILTDNAIDAGTGNVTVNSVLGSITEGTSNTTANITTSGTVDLTAGTSIGASGDLVDIATATDLTFNVNDDLFVNGSSGQTISALDVTVDPSGAATYSLTGFNAAQTFNLSTNGTDLTVTNFNNSGTVNQTLTAKSGNVSVLFMDSLGSVSATASAGNLVIGSGGINFTRNNTVTLDASGTISGTGLNFPSVTQGTKIFNTGTTTIGTLTLSGGTVTANGTVNVTTFNWTGTSTIDGSGSFNTSGTSTISNSVVHTLDAVTWNNSGTATWNTTGGQDIAFANSATFNNTGTFNLNATNAGSGFSGTGSVTNTGTFAHGSSVNNNIESGVTFDNDGQVNVTAGTLTILDNGTTDTGDYDVSSGATLIFGGGTRNFASTTDFTGTGNVSFTGGTHTLTDSSYASTLNSTIDGSGVIVNFDLTSGLTVADLTLAIGTMQGSGDITVTNSFTWTDNGGTSTIGGSGTFTTTSGVSAGVIGGQLAYVLDRDWNNAGTITFNNTGGQNLTISSGKTLTNTGTFNLNVTNNSDIIGSGTFSNSGTVSTGSSGNEQGITATFINTNAVNVAAGDLRLTGDITDSGTLDVSSGQALIFGTSTNQNFSSNTFSGTGSVDFSSGTQTLTNSTYASTLNTTIETATVNFNISSGVTIADLTLKAGTMQGSSDITVTNSFTWSDTGGTGTIGGSGTFTTTSGVSAGVVGGQLAYVLDRDWNNAGTITYNNTGGQTLTISSGKTLTNTGTFNLNVTNGGAEVVGAGTFDNSGTVNTGGTVPQNIDTIFNNTGTVNVSTTDLNIANTGTDTGTYDVSSGRTITFNHSTGNRTFNTTSEFTGAGNFTFSSSDTTTFTNVTMKNTGTVTFSGTTLTTGGTNLSITANDIAVSSALTATGADVTIIRAGGGTIGLGATSGNMSITDAELDLILADNVNIGDRSVGAITVNGISASSSISNLLTITSGSSIAFNTGASSITKNLAVVAGNDITQSAGLSVTGTSSFTVTGTNVMTLTNAANDFTGAVTLSSGTGLVQITDTTSLTLAASTLGGALTVNADDGVTLSGSLTTAGTATIDTDVNADGTGDFSVSSGTLNTGNNDLTVTTNDVTVNISGAASIATGTGTTSFIRSTAGTVGLGDSNCGSTCGMQISGSEFGAITAANMLISTSSGAITVDNVTAANTANISNTLTLITGSTVDFETTASNFTNSLAVFGGGNISQNVALTIGGSSTFSNTAGDITMNNASNNLGNNLTLNTTGDIDVATTSTLTDLDVTIDHSGGARTYAISATGLTFSATDQGSDVEIVSASQSGLNFSFTTSTGNLRIGDLAVSTGAGNVTLVSTVGAINEANNVGTVNISATGAVSLTGATGVGSTSTLDISGTANLTVDTNQSIDIANDTTLTDLTLTVDPGSTADTYSITDGGNLTLTMSDLGTDITLNSATPSSGNLNFSLTTDTGNIDLGDNAISTGSGNVTLVSTLGDINETNNNATANITTTGSVSLTGAGGVGNTSALDVASSGNLTIDTNNSFNVDAGSTALTDLSITVDPANTSTYTLSGASNISAFTLTDSTSDVDIGGLTLSSGNLNFSLNADTGAIATSGAIDVGTGSFTLINNDTGTSSAITIGSTLDAGSLTITANGQFSDININQAVTITSGNVTLTADDAVNFGATTGDLTATGAGNVVVTANNVVTDGNSFDVISMSAGSSINAGSGTITLNAVGTNAGNNIFRQLTTTSSSSSAIVINALANVTFSDTVSAASGGVSVTSSTGNISQSAALTVGGTSTFDTSAGEGTITLTNASNDFTGAVSSNSGIGQVQITDTNAIVLGTSTMAGNFTLSTTGAVTQTGVVIAAGTTTIAAGSGNDITLTNSSNDFGTVDITNGNNVSVTDTNDLMLGASTISNTATFNATGDLVVNGNLTSSGATILNADSDKSGAGDFSVSSGITVDTNNNTLTLQGAATGLNTATSVTSGSALTTINLTKSTTVDGSNLAKITASALTVNVTGDFTVNGVTSTELSGIGSGTGLLTLYASNDLIFQTTASDHGGALTLEADNDIKIQANVTAAGNIDAEADHDKNNDGDFSIDTGVTMTSSAGNIDVTAVAITEDGTLSAPSGTITRTVTATTEAVTAEEEEQIDEGAQSTFTQQFTAPSTDSGC